MEKNKALASIATLSEQELINAQEVFVEFIFDTIDNHMGAHDKNLDDYSEEEQVRIIRLITKQIVSTIL